MNNRQSTLYTLCLGLMSVAGFAVQAGMPKLPPNAISDDTYLIANVDLSKADLSNVEAMIKSALGEKAFDVEDLLNGYKTHCEKYAFEGAESITVILRGDLGNPDKPQEPQKAFYVKFKPGVDQAAVEKKIREEQGEKNVDAQNITRDGDFLVLRRKGEELPATGSKMRTMLFTAALGNFDKPVSGAVILNDVIKKGLLERISHVAPAMTTLATVPVWYRFEMTLGEAATAEIMIQTSDEDAAKQVAFAVTGQGDLLRTAFARKKKRFAQLNPQWATRMRPQLEYADAAATMSEAFKPRLDGANVNLTADVNAIGGALRVMAQYQRFSGANEPAAKGGL